MHYLTTILVKEENVFEMDETEIISIAEMATEDYQGTAFDWRETHTAGRWADEFPNNVIYASKELDRVIELLKDVRNANKAKLDFYMDKLSQRGYSLEKLIENYKADAKNTGLELYCLSCIAKILKDEYNDETCFYNTDYCDATISEEVLDDVKNNPQDYALVFFDCHN